MEISVNLKVRDQLIEGLTAQELAELRDIIDRLIGKPARVEREVIREVVPYCWPAWPYGQWWSVCERVGSSAGSQQVTADGDSTLCMNVASTYLIELN